METEEKSGDLKDGQFNEQESHNEFLNALNAWRNAGKKEEPKPPSDLDEKKVRFSDDPKAPVEDSAKKEKKGFLYTVGDEENFDMNAIPTFEEKGQEAAKPNPQMAKESCWNCYKLFTAKDGIKDQASDKKFCTQACYDKFLAVNMQTCALKDCPNKF
jgi:hypothetical protein